MLKRPEGALPSALSVGPSVYVPANRPALAYKRGFHICPTPSTPFSVPLGPGHTLFLST